VNREICLSISGHHEETWQPAWGIRTALTAIRSFMEGDAKGQVGGIEAKEEVRREWATRSREWRCDVCSQGKTNEEILKDWWEICQAKGVIVDKDGNATETSTVWDRVPKGLKLGYKDEIEQQNEPKKLQEAQEEENPATENATTDPLPSAERPIPSTPAQNPIRPWQGHRSGRVLGPSIPTGSAETAAPTSDVVDPAPAAAQDTIGLRHQGNALPRSAPATSADEPWLDRAIIVVIVALVLMVLKKIFLE